MTQLCWPSGKLDQEPNRTDNYGPREPILTSDGWTRPYHVGTDWAGIGRICSIGDGVVAENHRIGWAGWQVLIDLGVIDGERTWVRDCHFAEQSTLRVGDRVSMGQFIGTEGATGQVTGRHLHKEIYRGSVDRGSGSNPGSTVDPAKFIAAHLAPPSGGLPLFALYWTGPQVNNTRVSGRMVTGYGSFWVPSMQIMGLLNRRHDAALKPGDSSDNMLDAEHDIINGFLQTCFKSVLTGVTLDPAKLRAALTDALKAAGTNITVDADTDVPVEALAKAFEVASPRIAAAMVKQAGQAMAK